jgi:hypothetical protein
MDNKDIKRFWKHVDIIHDRNDTCWEWTSYKNVKGYGLIKIKKYVLLAHRVAYEIRFGQFDQSKYICHTCDNRSCCNPNHLFIGTQFDNMRDMVSKGRKTLKCNEDNPNVKLTDKQVVVLREMRKDGMLMKDLAEVFNIGIAQVSCIINNKNRILS